MEMSFADEEDVIRETERLLRRLWLHVINLKTPETFPRMTYRDAMASYGSDKPDLRYESKVSMYTNTPIDPSLTRTDTQHYATPHIRLDWQNHSTREPSR
jgi:aspartyl-tRNA synthetase